MRCRPGEELLRVGVRQDVSVRYVHLHGVLVVREQAELAGGPDLVRLEQVLLRLLLPPLLERVVEDDVRVGVRRAGEEAVKLRDHVVHQVRDARDGLVAHARILRARRLELGRPGIRVAQHVAVRGPEAVSAPATTRHVCDARELGGFAQAVCLHADDPTLRVVERLELVALELAVRAGLHHHAEAETSAIARVLGLQLGLARRKLAAIGDGEVLAALHPVLGGRAVLVL
eukprot:4566424-Prymnesium_polylepis.2